jgi:hypothetical protein
VINEQGMKKRWKESIQGWIYGEGATEASTKQK